ncbi:YkvA family protein [Actinacidiphila alni]|uniref:YkvA family protein n=1 Tax=Actinacidiphila alni TaxID=380248 RepID=UPI0034520FAC
MVRSDRRPGRGPVSPRTARSAWGLYRETRRPGEPGLFRRLIAAPRLVSAVLRHRYPGLSRGKLLGFALLAAVYVVSPLDAIPDVIPVLGWTDDSAVLLWFVAGLVRESGRFVSWEAGGRPGSAEPPCKGGTG